MPDEKILNRGMIKQFHTIYNEGKYGKINESDINDTYLLNKRVVSEEQFATIRYVGKIPGSTGIWLGVDWDDETRGRHNGTFNNIKYFDTWSLKSGTFVRPGKVLLGLTVEEAIEIRYGQNQDIDSKYIMNEFILESSDSEGECGTSGVAARSTRSHSNQKVKVHFSGSVNGVFNVSSAQMDRIKTATLNCLPVFRCKTEAEGGCKLNEMAPQLEELDVAQTLFSDWRSLAEICKQLPKLKQLNVSDNKFQSHSIATDETKQLFYEAFGNIVYLILVRIYYSWEEFYKLFDYFPHIEHICLAYNKLSRLIPSVHRNFDSLAYIDLACNDIHDFENDILPFGCLKNLQTLLLNDNKIENIAFPGKVTEDCDLFSKLILIAISNNRISSWNSIHHLSRLKSLKELIFMFNPILNQQKNQETARQDVIAKLHRIKILNRNEIKYDERKGAEIDYLKRYGKKWLECISDGGDTEDVKLVKEQNLAIFFEEHPRFLKLIDLYGAPEQSEMKEMTQKLKERLLEVVFEYPDADGAIKFLKKRIPSHMTVQQIRSLVRRLCKLSSQSEFNLVYISNSRPELEILIESDTREIGFYNVEAGDRVIIHLNS